jgi:hypothetical protein
MNNTPAELTRDERLALNELVPVSKQTGDLETDLASAAKEAMRRRKENSRIGGAVINALHERTQSWKQVAELTDIPLTTARRWAEPPQTATEADTESD